MTKTKHTQRKDNERRQQSRKAREEVHAPAWLTRVGRAIASPFKRK